MPFLWHNDFLKSILKFLLGLICETKLLIILLISTFSTTIIVPISYVCLFSTPESYSPLSLHKFLLLLCGNILYPKTVQRYDLWKVLWIYYTILLQNIIIHYLHILICGFWHCFIHKWAQECNTSIKVAYGSLGQSH